MSFQLLDRIDGPEWSAFVHPAHGTAEHLPDAATRRERSWRERLVVASADERVPTRRLEIHWSDRAKDDLAAIGEYIAAYDPVAAVRWVDHGRRAAFPPSVFHDLPTCATAITAD